MHELTRILDGAMLNDEDINAYLSTLQTKDPRRIVVFSTFFYTKLCEEGYSGVARWTKKENIFQKRLIIVPIHIPPLHWVLAVVDMNEKTLEYYDSLRGDGSVVLKKILEYLRLECERLAVTTWNGDQWLLKPRCDCSMQDNGVDCGVFVCKNAQQRCLGRIHKYPSDMLAFRQEIARSLKKI